MSIGQAHNPLEAQEYAKLTGFDGKWRETWWRKDFLQLIAQRCDLTQAHSVLDVGCGVGHWGRTLSQVLPATASMTGIDIEPAFIDRSMELGKAFGLAHMEYKVGHAESIPYAANSFDLVTCQTVLIHVKNPKAVLAEMKRVLKPGGTLLLAEPNNLVGYLSLFLTEPRPAWHTVKDLLDFYHTCLQGKRELGMGDSSVGDRLPTMASEVGFDRIHVAINENCPTLIPPYAEEEQQIECEFLKNCLNQESWLGFGPRHNAEPFFVAGGGDQTQFTKLWEMTMGVQRGILTAMENKTYGGGRGSMMYVISANKP